MSDSTLWWLLAGGCVVLELVTGTFYLLMLAVGLSAGALAAHAGASTSLQLVAAALTGAGVVALWQKWRRKNRSALPAEADRDVNLDIGQTVHVTQWNSDGSAQVKYRGAFWNVSLQNPDASLPAPGPYRIAAIQGSQLIVTPL